MKIQHVAIEYRHQLWGQIEGYFRTALDYAPEDYTLEQIKTFVVTGQWLLIVAVDEQNNIHGAMTLSFVTRPNDRVAFVTGVGGKFIINENTYSQLVTLVKGFGATYIEAAGRKSIVRMLRRYGLKEKYTIVGARI